MKNYEENLLEPELRPDYKVKLAKIIKGKHLSKAESEKEID